MTPVLDGVFSMRQQDHAADRPGVMVLGVPWYLGGPGPGPEAGPTALRAAGLLTRLQAAGLTPVDWGDVVVPPADAPGASGPRNAQAVVTLAGIVAGRVGAALDSGLLPLVLGGDHSISLGTIAASAARAPVGVLWFDAHGDFNTPETSPSGNVYGMVLAILAGLGAAPLVGCLSAPVPGNRIAIIGARSLDSGERRNLREAGVAVYTTEAIRALGPAEVTTRALAGLGAAGAEQVHVSLDLDVLDPSVAPGVWTRAADGLTVDETRQALRVVAQSGRLRALDVTELFPGRDPDGVTTRAALSLIKTALARHRPLQALDWRAVQAGLRSSA
jgi:arginase